MRKIIMALCLFTAALLVTLSLTPAGAVAPVPVTSQAGTPALVAPPKADALASYITGRKFLSGKVCVADGAASFALEQYLPLWNSSQGALELVVRNACVTNDGIRNDYYIQNRMTVQQFDGGAGSGCAVFYNWHTNSWGIWDQNPIIKLNTHPSCTDGGNGTEAKHRASMYVGYILGLDYRDECSGYVMAAVECSYITVPYPTTNDKIDMLQVYGARA